MPDSRKWTDGPPYPQFQMIWPRKSAGQPARAVAVPDGYELRQYRPADEAGYIELMAKAGFTGWTA